MNEYHFVCVKKKIRRAMLLEKQMLLNAQNSTPYLTRYIYTLNNRLS
jgi:hypothetical protein